MTRLKKQRYGEYNLKAPNKYDIDDYGLKTTKLRKPVSDLFDTIIYQFLNPPIRDRYYLHYIRTVNMYLESLDSATKQSVYQSRTNLVDLHLTAKLIYMENHPNRFGGGYHNFKYTWMFDALSYMRAYTINRNYFNGSQDTNNTTANWSSGFVQFPKPMTNRAMSALSDNIYDIIQPRRELIIKRSGLV